MKKKAEKVSINFENAAYGVVMIVVARSKLTVDSIAYKYSQRIGRFSVKFVAKTKEAITDPPIHLLIFCAKQEERGYVVSTIQSTINTTINEDPATEFFSCTLSETQTTKVFQTLLFFSTLIVSISTKRCT